MVSRREFLRGLSLFTAMAGGAGVGGWSRADGGVVVVEGVRLDERIVIAGQALLLNGTGLRSVAWFKGYLAVLYLPRRVTTAPEALALAGPKRVRLVMLRGAPSSELAKAFEKGVLRNATPAEQAGLRERLDSMLALMRAAGDVRERDAVDLDFEPGRGTTLRLNGRVQGAAVAGPDFYAAVLRSFIGEHPYQKSMRAGLLGSPP